MLNSVTSPSKKALLSTMLIHQVQAFANSTATELLAGERLRDKPDTKRRADSCKDMADYPKTLPSFRP